MISFSARSKRLYLLWDSYCISEFSPANVGFHVCTKRHRYQFTVLKSQGRIVSTYSWRLWMLFRAISWNCICISDLATVWINTLLWMAKAFLIAAAVFREMSWYTYSQQLEYLVNTSGYGVHTYIEREGKHLPFSLLWIYSNSVCISGSFQSVAGPVYIYFFIIIKFQWLMFIYATIDTADQGFA